MKRNRYFIYIFSPIFFSELFLNIYLFCTWLLKIKCGYKDLYTLQKKYQASGKVQGNCLPTNDTVEGLFGSTRAIKMGQIEL